MAKIKQIYAREIINSKAIPTIETTVELSDGSLGVASCPGGTSIGSYEAVELRDRDPNRFKGLGVLKAIQNVVTVISPKLIGLDPTHQQEIDRIMIELDGTQNKSRLGANAILSVSMAVAKAAAESSVLPLFLYLRNFISEKNTPLRIPTPIFNIINGVKHGESLDFQEFILVPASSKLFVESLENATNAYHNLKDILHTNGLTTLVGDEGGFGPKVSTNYDALSLLSQAVEASNLRLGFDMFLGIDAASDTFYSNQQYKILDKGNSLSSKNLNDYYAELVKQFHILYLEDILSEDDWDGWTDAMQKLSKDALIVGDDLIATNPYRLQIAIDKKAVTAVIIKPNQIGTVIEAMAVVEVARAAGLKVVVSHRSGETNDDFIADFAVAVGADYCKLGAPARGGRVAKVDRLLQIEERLKSLK